MATDNIHLDRLLASIRGEGFDVREMWRASIDNGHTARLYTVQNAADGREPAVRSFVVVDYKGDGYALYVEQPNAKITGDVEAILGLPEGTAGLTDPD